MKPTIGRILHYGLSKDDIARLPGEKPHRNHHSVGQLVPLIVVCVWKDEFGPDKPGVNGQAILDGDHSLWILSAGEGTEPGTWRWPERAA